MSVYFVQAETTKRIKIGYSKNVVARVKGLQTGCSEQLVLLLVIDGSADSEKNLHRRFASLRLQGEWFKAGEKLLAFIASRRRQEPWVVHIRPRGKQQTWWSGGAPTLAEAIRKDVAEFDDYHDSPGPVEEDHRFYELWAAAKAGSSQSGKPATGSLITAGPFIIGWNVVSRVGRDGSDALEPSAFLWTSDAIVYVALRQEPVERPRSAISASAERRSHLDRILDAL